MRRYAQLTQEQRYQIYAFIKGGFNQTETAAMVGVHKSIISREFSRNTGRRGYRASQAHRLALGGETATPGSKSLMPWELIDHLLGQDWSPEQISDSVGRRQQRQH